MTRVLVAGSDRWVATVEEAIRAASGLTLASRCEDLPDLLARVAAGMGDTVVVGGDLDGLDLDSVSTLHHHGVAVVAVAASPDAREWLTRLGVDRAVPPAGDAAVWTDVLTKTSAPVSGVRAEEGLLAVWGAQGGPGATTVAISLALASHAAGTRTILIDLDPAGASIAQQMGLSDSGSGIERACRAALAGTLTPAMFDSLTSTTTGGLKVLTGVLRPDRWVDLRRSALEAVIAVARSQYDRVVCDVGSDIYDVSDGGTPRPSTATAVGIDAADHLVLVGSADSVGVARLLRGVDQLAGSSSKARKLDAVINRCRPTLGWSRRELRDLFGEVAPRVQLSFLPLDVESADAAAHFGGSPWLCRSASGKEPEGALGSALHEMTSGILDIECLARAHPIKSALRR